MDDRALARIPTRWEPKMATGFVEKSLSMATRQTYQRNVREFFAFVDYVHPARVTSDDVPMPYALNLEKQVVPQPADVIAAVKKVLYLE